MRRRRYVLGLAVALAVATVVEGPLAANAAGPRPDFQLPFPCGQQWRIDSWAADHEPALDMVKEPWPSVPTEGSLLVAPAAGRVNQSFFHSNAGNLIQIDHGDGWFTTYIHLQSRAVAVGEQVSQGETIGRVGHTGPTSNGVPHLHFEQAVDSNGDGSASWGFEGAERVTSVFNGVQYGTAAGQTYRNVTSHNCDDEPGRLDVFARGSGNALAHRWFIQDGGGWRNWEPLGGSLTSGPAVASWGSGRLDVFARGTEDQLLHRWFSGNWSNWENLGGTLASAPAAASWGSGRLDVFVRGTDNRLHHKWFHDGAWSSWENLGGTLASAPAVASWGSGRLDVFARGTDNHLKHTWYVRDDGGWRPYEDLGGTLTSEPAVAAQ